jgi:glycosyltransferase involved in cell wall biosynthesis
MMAHIAVVNRTSMLEISRPATDRRLSMSEKRPLRILHLVASERWTGVAEPATSVALHHLGAGCEVSIACIPERSLEERLRTMPLPMARGIDLARHLWPPAILAQIAGLRRHIESTRPHVVHTHLVHDHWLAALAIRKVRGANPLLVRTVHRYEQMLRDPLHRRLFERHTDLVITVSTAQRDLIAAAYPAAVPHLRVILGGVDAGRFRPDPAGRAMVRGDLGERPDAMVAGIVAHLGYNRGHRWLMAAAPRVVEEVPNAVVWIVGQGEIKYELRAEARRPEYRSRVIMAGYRDDDLAATYAAMDVGLLLGLGSEGTARAALEAMATARPVIGVRKGALLDTITHGEDGLLVPENNARALSAALIELLGNPEKTRQMGEAARRKMLASFTEERRAERTMEAYLEALGRKRGAIA